MTKARDFAMMVGRSEALNPDRVALLDGDAVSVTDSASINSIIGTAGVTVYDSLGLLPTSSLTAGQQAFVNSNNRLYISNGSGWYNVAAINATPTLTLSSTGTIALTAGSATTITMTAADSDGTTPELSLESGGDLFKFATVSRDSSVVTITPRTSDSANSLGFDGSATLTFKASDGIGVASVQNTFTLSFSTPDTNFTRFLLKADGSTDTQVDASGTPNTFGVNGTLNSLAYSPYHPGGYSATFVDTNNNITVPAATGSEYRLGPDTGWTLEVWLYSTNFTNAQVVFHQRNQLDARGTVVSIATNGAITFYQGDANNSAWEVTLSCGTISANTWTHLAIVRNGSGSNNYKSYLNGTQQAQATYAGSSANRQVAGYIGGGDSTYISNNVEFRGYMRDFRYTESAVYTGNFTAPTKSLTVLSDTKLLYFNGEPYIQLDTVDKASVYGDATSRTKVYTQRHGPYDYLGYTKAANGGSLAFGASSSYITVDTGNIESSWGNNFTVEFWLHKDTSYDGYIFDNRIGANSNGFYIRSNSAGIDLAMQGGGVSGIGPDPLLQWSHLAFTFSGTEGKSYLNGKLTNTYTIADTASHTYHRTTNTIGSKQWTTRGDESLGQYKGALTDFRITKSLVYTSEFTPPTSPLTSDSNTLLLTCTNKNNIFDISGMANTGGIGGLGETPYGAKPLVITAGTPAPSTTQRKWTDSHSIHFEGGTGGSSAEYYSTYINEPFGTRDFTIEAWVWPAAAKNYGYVVQISGTAGGVQSSFPGTVGFGLQSGKWRMLASGGWPINGYISGTTSYTADTWHHIAMVRTGGNSKLYLNGTEEITISDTYDYTGDNMAIGCGNAGNYGFNGYIQDFRISRKAIYTGNFTAPTATFDG